MEFSQKQFAQKVMTITPELAEEMLRQNTNNFRPITQERVSSFADQIVADKWRFGANSIKFDKDGVLADGQHTLTAVIKAGKPIQSVVFFGLEQETILAIDTGSPRKGPDIFRHLGVPFPIATAAALQGIRAIMGEIGPGRRSIAPQMLYSEWYEKYKDAVNWSVPTIYATANPCRNQSVAAALALAYRRGTKTAMEEFAGQLVTGQNLAAGSPALAVRNYYINRYNSTCDNDGVRDRALKVLGAAYAHVKHEAVTKLYVGPGLEAIDFFVKDDEAVAKAMAAEAA